MKNKGLILLLLVLAPYCYSSSTPVKSYSFEYRFKGESYPVNISKASYEDALEEAATQCFNHFANSKGNDKVNLAPDIATDLIDECANPSKRDTDLRTT